MEPHLESDCTVLHHLPCFEDGDSANRLKIIGFTYLLEGKWRLNLTLYMRKNFAI